MAYTRHDWECGETISAELLNNLEDGVEEALACCEGGGGSGDVGYECKIIDTVLTEESVTTRLSVGPPYPYGALSYSGLIDADTLHVVFDGTEYVVSKETTGGSNFYGGVGQSGPDDRTYPFAIESGIFGNQLYTEVAGTYSLKITAPQEGAEVSDCFTKAVKSISNAFVVTVSSSGSTRVADKTIDEILEAIKNGRHVYLYDPADYRVYQLFRFSTNNSFKYADFWSIEYFSDDDASVYEIEHMHYQISQNGSNSQRVAFTQHNVPVRW